jgi:uncharacterized membrane protein YdjX (TVP38/TMEM64 family)
VPDPSPTTSARRRVLTRVLLALAIVAAVVLLGRGAAGRIPAFAAWVEGLGIWGPIVFVAGYAVACVLLLPASLLTLAAGAIFGVRLGVPLVLAGATLGAAAAFLIARHAGREVVLRRLARHPRLAAIDGIVGARGGRVVLLMRLSPVFPFAALNYALGVTRLRFRDFLVAMIGIVPGTTLYVYSGAVAGAVASAAGAAGTETPARGLAHHALLALGLVATLVVTVLVTRAARRALADAEHAGAMGPDDGRAAPPPTP